MLHIQPKIFDGSEKERIRQQMIARNRGQDRDPRNCGKKLTDGLTLEPVTLPNASGWLVTGRQNPKEKIIYYIHGGGFTGACTKDRMPFISALVRDFGYNVFSVDYRLAPEFMYPCGLNDCLDGCLWLLEHHKPEDILFLGESAGGNLVLSLCLLLRDRGLPLPKAVYANSPVTQLTAYPESYDRFSLKEDFIVVRGILENTWGIYVAEKGAGLPYVSPLYADLKNLPPVFLTVSGCECLLDDSRAMAKKLQEAGNACRLRIYPGLCHAFIVSPQMKQVRKLAYPELQDYLKQNLH